MVIDHLGHDRILLYDMINLSYQGMEICRQKGSRILDLEKWLWHFSL